MRLSFHDRVTLMVVQFNVSNTIPDTVLEQVAVVMQPSAESSLTEDFIIPLPSLSSATSPGIVYVSFTRDSPEGYASGSFQCTLKFVSKEVDPSTGEPEEDGYEDEYQLEEVELGAGDYIIPTYVTFSSEWDRLRGGPSATETFSLSAMESLKGDLRLSIIDFFSLLTECSFHSCLRFHHRDSQHASAGGHRRYCLNLCPHIATGRVSYWRWGCWEGVGEMQDDVLEDPGGDTRIECAGGEGGSVQSGRFCHWRLRSRTCFFRNLDLG